MLTKGLAAGAADRIGRCVQRRSSLPSLLAELRQDADLCANESVAAGLADLGLLATYLDALHVSSVVSFDLALARDLDCYTGIIYEVVPAAISTDAAVGSIAAGGRYDNLIGMYGTRPVPCVGVSYGMDRICTALNARRTNRNAHKTPKAVADVYVMSFGGDGLLVGRMRVATLLWDAGIHAEYTRPRRSQSPSYSSRHRPTCRWLSCSGRTSWPKERSA